MGNLKNIIKKFPSIVYLYRNKKYKKEFNYDKKFFLKNYIYSKETESTIGYKVILLVHSLEKGMANKKLRRFGKEKISELINELLKYQQFSRTNYEFIIGINTLREYIKIYENNKWTNEYEYIKTKEFLADYKDVKQLDVSTLKINKKDIMKFADIDYNSFLESRHSIRSFDKNKLKDSDVKKAVSMVLKTPSACNRQMCKVYQIKNKRLVDLVIKKGQGFSGFEKDSINIFVITFDVNANYFVGERNQGWFNAGLLSMNFVNALHSLGIGSCFIQFGNSVTEEEELKKEFKISKSERIAVILAAGYYETESLATASPRKDINDIFITID